MFKKFLGFFLLIGLVYPFPTNQNNNFEFKASSIQNLIRNKGWSCKDVLKYFLERAVKYDPLIRSIISYNPKAFQRAQELD